MLFQPMPELSDDQFRTLRDNIKARGILVPIVVDQHGRILDGHNRFRIATELGIEYPTEVREVRDDQDAGDIAVELNCSRRHLTREQVRQVIHGEILRRPDDSDRAIARRVGCSPSTVASVRRPEVSKLDTLSVEEAEERTREIGKHFWAIADDLYALVQQLLSNGIPAAEVLMALTVGKAAFAADEEMVMAPVADLIYDPLIRHTIDPKTQEFWRPHYEHETFLPMAQAEIDSMLDALRCVREAA